MAPEFVVNQANANMMEASVGNRVSDGRRETPTTTAKTLLLLPLPCFFFFLFLLFFFVAGTQCCNLRREFVLEYRFLVFTVAQSEVRKYQVPP